MKRIMLKISGEVLGSAEGGIDPDALLTLCNEIKAIVKSKVQVAIVVGGGNFWRFRDNKKIKISRADSDTIGMMATIMNARVLQDALRSIGVKANALAPHVSFYFAEPFVASRGIGLLERGEVVICGGGTGNPYFTTDSAAALRALELNCDVLMKATKVDGVYDSDPVKNPKAKFFDKISYDEVLKRGLEVMDLNAIVLAKENGLKVQVFNLKKSGNLLKAVKGKKIGTLIS
ncbi:MAG: UMP kinase [Patescibacteria group bacterium]